MPCARVWLAVLSVTCIVKRSSLLAAFYTRPSSFFCWSGSQTDICWRFSSCCRHCGVSAKPSGRRSPTVSINNEPLLHTQRWDTVTNWYRFFDTSSSLFRIWRSNNATMTRIERQHAELDSRIGHWDTVLAAAHNNTDNSLKLIAIA